MLDDHGQGLASYTLSLPDACPKCYYLWTYRAVIDRFVCLWCDIWRIDPKPHG